MPNYRYELLKPGYDVQWAKLEILPAHAGQFNLAAAQIARGKERYVAISQKTGVPWYFIGMLHLRESNCNFSRHLHNGDPLSGRTYHVPAGYPRTGTPPFSFEYSAIDALTMMGFTKITDWGIAQIAYRSEMYNGFGYRMNGLPSAYLWAGTNQYKGGKYVSDGVFSRQAWDTQLGCMGVLKAIMELTGEKPVSQQEVAAIQDPSPKAVIPVPTSKEMNKVSRKFWYTDWLQWITGSGAAVTAAAKGIDTAQIQATKSFMDSIKIFAADYGIYFVVFALLGIGLFCALQKQFMKQDVAEGRSLPSGTVDEPHLVIPAADGPGPIEPAVAQ